MVPRARRLPVGGISGRARRIEGEHLSLRVVKTNIDALRIGVVVSKAVSPLATKRNALKRALYAEALSLPLQNIDTLVIIKKNTSTIPWVRVRRVIREELRNLLLSL